MKQQFEETGTSITLMDLWMMVRRNIYSIVYFTILGLVLGLMYTNVIVTPEYTATGAVAMKASATTTVLNTITEIARSNPVAEEALLALEEDGVTKPNGTALTAADITTGVTATYTSTSLIVTVAYKTEYEALALPVANVVIDATIAYGNANYTVIANNLILSSYATEAINTGPSTTLYLAIYVMLGAVVGAGLGIVTDIIEDRVHYLGEIKATGVNAFSVAIENGKDKKKKKDGIELSSADLDIVDAADFSSPYFKDMLKLQNDIENFTPDKQVKTIAVTSTKEYQSKLSLLISMAQVYAKEHQKVLVLDFDFEAPRLHEMLGVQNHNNIVTYYLSFKPKEEFLAEIAPNFALMPGMTSAIGSKIIKSDRIKKLIEEARKEYDYVLINFPPTLKDVAILAAAPLLDGVLIAGRFQVTKKKDFLKTAQTVVGAEMHLIGGAFLAPTKEKFNLRGLFAKSSR